MKPFLYVRAMRHVEHSVFSVNKGQKYYKDPLFGKEVAYSSGQQIKRSIMDAMTTLLNVPFAPVTFNWNIPSGKPPKQGEAWSKCDPSYPDQLIGGYMKTTEAKTEIVKDEDNADEEKDDSKEKNDGNKSIKRRSPLSISAMRPVHPLLGGIEWEDNGKGEAMSFDRGSYADHNPVIVWKIVGDGKKKQKQEMTDDEIKAWLGAHDRISFPPKKWINPQKRSGGLFVYDIAIDLRTLFCVSTNQYEPELTPETIEKLKKEGWIEGENVFGKCLICPAPLRERIIEALAEALLEWRITSNQARTFSVMDTMAVAISDNANQIAYAIRAALDEESEYNRAIPIIDKTAKAQIYVTPSASSVIKGEKGYAAAVEDAKAYLIEQLKAFPYEKQMS